MANGNMPRGLVPKRHQSGAPFNGSGETFAVAAGDATPIYIGGLVKMAGTGDGDYVPTATGNVSTGNRFLGVVMGLHIDGTSEKLYREGGTATKIIVATDPDLAFEIQEDSVGGAIPATAIGNVAKLTNMKAGDTGYGHSQMMIDSSTVTAAGTGVEDVLLVGLVQRPDNEPGEHAKWIVRLLKHEYHNTNTGS